MKIHGHWKITLVGNVMVRTTFGSFNLEGTQACYLDQKNKAPVGTPWASLNNGLYWDMSTLDSLRSFPEMREWAFKNGCVCVAVVLSDQLRQQIHKIQTGNLPEDVLSYFSNIEDACHWLTQRGFAISAADYPHDDFIDKMKKLQKRGAA